MGAPIRVGLLVIAALLSLPVQADSLQCNGGTVQEGDSRASLLQKCGQPRVQDSFCAPVFENKALVPSPLSSNAAPCQQIDDYIYDQNRANQPATVRIRDGSVQSIRVQRRSMR